MLSDTAFAPHEDHDGHPTGIDETVEFKAGTRLVEIANGFGAVLGSVAVSANLPLVSSAALAGGLALPSSGPVTVSWQASDPDGDRLVANVLWSGNGGASFVPLASGISRSSVTLDASAFSGTHGRPDGVVRVLVRDPVNTASADLPGLSAVGADPHLQIAAPSNGQSFVRGQNIPLQAFASDQDGGGLDSSVRWSSDRDGALGSGGYLTPLLSRGTHVLTATVTDSDGRVATKTRTVEVFNILPPGTHRLRTPGLISRPTKGRRSR